LYSDGFINFTCEPRYNSHTESIKSSAEYFNEGQWLVGLG